VKCFDGGRLPIYVVLFVDMHAVQSVFDSSSLTTSLRPDTYQGVSVGVGAFCLAHKVSGLFGMYDRKAK